MIVRKYILAALVYIALLSFILQIIVVVVSWLICVLSPDSGVQSLLSQEGIRWMAGKLPEAMSTDTLLSLLYISLAVGTLIGSGLLACFIPQNVNASERTEYREQSTEYREQSTENRVQSTEERAKMEDEREKEKGRMNLLRYFRFFKNFPDTSSRYAYGNRIGLQMSIVTAVACLSLLLYLVAGPDTVLLSATGTFAGSSFVSGLIPLLSSIFMLVAVVYGVCASSLRSLQDVFNVMSDGVKTFAPLFVTYIFVAQCYYSLLYVLGYMHI